MSSGSNFPIIFFQAMKVSFGSPWIVWFARLSEFSVFVLRISISSLLRRVSGLEINRVVFEFCWKFRTILLISLILKSTARRKVTNYFGLIKACTEEGIKARGDLIKVDWTMKRSNTRHQTFDELNSEVTETKNVTCMYSVFNKLLSGTNCQNLTISSSTQSLSHCWNSL